MGLFLNCMKEEIWMVSLPLSGYSIHEGRMASYKMSLLNSI